MNLTPWQSTALALLGFIAGLALHLRWHPLRRHLSDAWDFVRLRPVLVLWVAGASLLATTLAEGKPAAYSLAQLTDWREIIVPLALDAVAHLALLPHVLIPPWPLACWMPLVFTILTIRIWRWPYRYGERRPGPEQKLLLLGTALTSIGWLVLEIVGLSRMLPEGAETVKFGARAIFTAFSAAGTQVWIARWLMAWERPQDTEADNDAVVALEHTFARWQNVACLAGFDLLWMMWHSWHQSTPGSIGGWLWIELLLLFAALPLAVAAVPGHFFRQGAVALRIVMRCAIPLLLLGITALALLILAYYASAVAHALIADLKRVELVAGRMIVLPLNALALAMLDCWLLLTAFLLMLRFGFPRSPSA